MQYRAAIPKDYKAIRELLIEVGWAQTLNETQFHQMLENSDRTVVVLEGSRIVGFARAVCDGVWVGYLTMVAVSPHKQGHGIGSKMVKTIIGHDPNIKWVLTSDSKSIEFWKKQGFSHLELTMIKPREKEREWHENASSSSSKTRKTLKKYIRNLIMKPRDLVKRNLSRWL